MRRIVAIALLSLAAAACASPEARRTRGGGSGADVGNRTKTVRMHEGSRQFWKTPVMIPGNGPSLAPSEHARSVSLEKGR